MRLGRISISDLPLIKSKIQSSDISYIRREFIESFSPGYLIRSISKDDTFYTILERPDEIQVSI